MAPKCCCFYFRNFYPYCLTEDQAKDLKMYLMWLSGWGAGGSTSRPEPLERAWRLHTLSPYGALCMSSAWLFLSSVI